MVCLLPVTGAARGGSEELPGHNAVPGDGVTRSHHRGHRHEQYVQQVSRNIHHTHRTEEERRRVSIASLFTDLVVFL